MIELREKVAAEPCRCVRCGACGESGTIWLDVKGRYLGNHRSDDLDDSEPCEDCGGRGIIETCARCQLLEEMDHETD